MSDNRGKTIEDCVVEREAEYAWLKHLTDPAEIKRCRQRITHLGNRIQKLNEKAREGTDHPQEAATPSDPHSAEAEARYPDPPPPTPWDYMSPPEEVRERERDAFIAGRVSRDAEVAELKAKIAAIRGDAHLTQMTPNPNDTGAYVLGSKAEAALFGSASSPVEGGN